MRQLKTLTLVLALLLAGAPLAQAGQTPTATVERLNATLLETMKSAQELGYQGRFEKLAPVLRETFDFPAMARVVLGTHWSSISAAQREDFIEAFSEYSIGVFASRFDGFSGEQFEIVGTQEARRGTVLVQNRIVKADGEEVAINYLTRPEDDTEADAEGWRIVDTILGGTYSEIATRRSEYSSIVEKTGIVSLIEALKDKTAAFGGQ